jgi:hypothetical protein
VPWNRGRAKLRHSPSLSSERREFSTHTRGMDAGARARMPLIWLAIWRACEYKRASIEQKNLLFGVLLHWNTHTKDQELSANAMQVVRVSESKQIRRGDDHLPGFNGLEKPTVWIFPEILICLDCGFAECAIPESELHKRMRGATA